MKPNHTENSHSIDCRRIPESRPPRDSLIDFIEARYLFTILICLFNSLTHDDVTKVRIVI